MMLEKSYFLRGGLGFFAGKIFAEQLSTLCRCALAERVFISSPVFSSESHRDHYSMIEVI